MKTQYRIRVKGVYQGRMDQTWEKTSRDFDDYSTAVKNGPFQMRKMGGFDWNVERSDGGLLNEEPVDLHVSVDSRKDKPFHCDKCGDTYESCAHW